jgi:tetratricopeptide (TPR) repeat protein
LYGPEPTARANAWIERGRWADAEAAFEEAVKARPEDGRIRWECGRFFAARSRPEEAAAQFAQALSLNGLHEQLTRPRGKPHESLLAAERAREELSKEVLTNRAIADRVCALVPRDLFGVLHPVVRARYWVSRGRWADAETAYKQAINEAIGEDLDSGAIMMECGRWMEARGELDKAFDYYWRAFLDNGTIRELSQPLSNRAIRDRFLAQIHESYLGATEVVLEARVLDAVFPEDPFAR